MTRGVQERMLAVEKLRDDFHSAVYCNRDVGSASSLVSEDCVLENLPSGVGAAGVADLRRYLTDVVFPHLPAELVFRRISRTGDRWRIAQEDLVSFIHDRELPWLLPGVAPTGRRAEVLAISIVTVPRTAITSHRTLWDYATLTTQLGAEPICEDG